MKTKTYCFSCEAKGERKLATTTVYIYAIDSEAPVCKNCKKEYLAEESTFIEDNMGL